MTADKTPEDMIKELTAVTEAATEVKIRQLKIEEKRAKIEKERVAELQRLARQDARRIKVYKKVQTILEELKKDIKDVKKVINTCSVREYGGKKLDEITYLLFLELSSRKNTLSAEAVKLLEIYGRETNVAVHTGTEIKAEGNMNTGDITGRNKK